MIEVLAALGITVASLVSIWYMLLLVQSQFSSLQNRIKSDIELTNLMFTVQHYTSMAVDLSPWPTPWPANITWPVPALPSNFIKTRGYITEYNLEKVWIPGYASGKIDALAYFLRDNLASFPLETTTTPSPANRFLPTGLFFQRPTVDKYGVLFLNFPTAKKPNEVAPGYQDFYFESLVDLQITDFKVLPPETPTAVDSAVFSVTFVVTQRHFSADSTNRPLKWCPPPFMLKTKECLNSRNYVDLTKSFTVKIRNNIIGTSKTMRKFDKPPPGVGLALQNYMPAEERVFGNIYFLRPTFPIGALKR